MRRISLALVLLLTGCGSGLLDLNANNDSGGNNGPIFIEPVGIYSGQVSSNSFSDTPGTSFPPNGLIAVASSIFSDLSNRSSFNQHSFTSTSPCGGTNSGPFAAIDFVFDVGTFDIGSYSAMQIQINSASAGGTAGSGGAPTSGNGGVEVFDSSGSGGWVQSSSGGNLGPNNNSISVNLNGPFGGWAWVAGGGPGSGQYLVVSMRSGSCSSGQFTSVSLQNIQLSLQ